MIHLKRRRNAAAALAAFLLAAVLAVLPALTARAVTGAGQRPAPVTCTQDVAVGHVLGTQHGSLAYGSHVEFLLSGCQGQPEKSFEVTMTSNDSSFTLVEGEFTLKAGDGSIAGFGEVHRDGRVAVHFNRPVEAWQASVWAEFPQQSPPTAEGQITASFRGDLNKDILAGRVSPPCKDEACRKAGLPEGDLQKVSFWDTTRGRVVSTTSFVARASDEGKTLTIRDNAADGLGFSCPDTEWDSVSGRPTDQWLRPLGGGPVADPEHVECSGSVATVRWTSVQAGVQYELMVVSQPPSADGARDKETGLQQWTNTAVVETATGLLKKEATAFFFENSGKLVDPASSPTPNPSPSDPAPSPTDPAPSPTDPAPSPTDPAPSPTDPAPSPKPTDPAPSPKPTDPAPSPEPTPNPSPSNPTPKPPADNSQKPIADPCLADDACNLYFADQFPASIAKLGMKIPAGGEVIAGDWDGDGVSTVAIRNGENYTFYDSNRSDAKTTAATFPGTGSGQVLVADFNGDKKDDIAVKNGNVFSIKYNATASGAADAAVPYGKAEDYGLAGDWDGDGKATLGVRRGYINLLRDTLTGGEADRTFAYGRSDDVAFVGDWNGDGKDTVSVRRGATLFVKNALSGGDADTSFTYGRASDKLVVGDWTGTGKDTVAVVREQAKGGLG